VKTTIVLPYIPNGKADVKVFNYCKTFMELGLTYNFNFLGVSNIFIAKYIFKDVGIKKTSI